VRLRDAAAWALVALWAAWAFGPLLGGYFLEDDFVWFAQLGHWQEQGRLFGEVARKFAAGIDPVNSFYRPLPYASFALNYVTSGTDAAPWIAVNLATHIANGVLVAVVAMQLAAGQGTQRGMAAGAAGAALFLFYTPSPEVFAWISGRYDAFATLFTLLTCALFLRSRRTGDAAWLGSIVSAVAALLSKESAAIVPFAILFLAWYRCDPLAGNLSRGKSALRAALPWIALAAAYLVWRYLIFGSALRVYEQSRPMETLLKGNYWLEFVRSVPLWYSLKFRSETWYPVLCALMAVHLAVIAVGWPAERRARDALIASAAAFVMTLALVIPHIGVLYADGLGGRLLYQSAAFFAIFSAVALVVTRWRRVLWGVTLALVVVHAALQAPMLARWLRSQDQMRDLVLDLARVHREIAPGGYALVLVPGALDGILFAGNAQAGLMLPPVQREVLSHRLLVQLYREIQYLPDKVRAGIVPFFRQRSLFDYLEGARIAAPLEYPTAVVCWDPARRRFVPLEVASAPSPEEWAAGVQRAVDASSCSATVRF